MYGLHTMEIKTSKTSLNRHSLKSTATQLLNISTLNFPKKNKRIYVLKNNGCQEAFKNRAIFGGCYLHK